MKIWIFRTYNKEFEEPSNERPDGLRLFASRQAGVDQFLDVAEYLGVHPDSLRDQVEEGGDLSVEFDGGDSIELYEQSTED